MWQSESAASFTVLVSFLLFWPHSSKFLFSLVISTRVHTRVLHCDEHQSQISNVRLNCSLPAKHKPLEDVPHSQGVTQSYTFPGGHNYFLFHQLVHHCFVCNFCGKNGKMKLALWVHWLPRWNTEIINKKSEHWTSLNSGLQWKWGGAGGCLGLFKCVLVIISTSGVGCIYIHYRNPEGRRVHLDEHVYGTRAIFPDGNTGPSTVNSQAVIFHTSYQNHWLFQTVWIHWWIKQYIYRVLLSSVKFISIYFQVVVHEGVKILKCTAYIMSCSTHAVFLYPALI